VTLSPDGNWMWDGTEWIPAPPSIAPPPSPQATHVVAPPQVTHYPSPPPPPMARPVSQLISKGQSSKLPMVIVVVLLVISGSVGVIYYQYHNTSWAAEELPGPKYRWLVTSLGLEFDVTEMKLSQGDEDTILLWELFFDINNTDDDRDGVRCWNSMSFSDSMTGTWWPPTFDSGSGSGPCSMHLNDSSELASDVNFCAYHNVTDLSEPTEGQMYDLDSWGPTCGVEKWPSFRDTIPEFDYEFNYCGPDYEIGLPYQVTPTGNRVMSFNNEGELRFEDGWDDSNSPPYPYYAKATITYDLSVKFECLEVEW
jgi:hypothetical protein